MREQVAWFIKYEGQFSKLSEYNDICYLQKFAQTPCYTVIHKETSLL